MAAGQAGVGAVLALLARAIIVVVLHAEAESGGEVPFEGGVAGRALARGHARSAGIVAVAAVGSPSNRVESHRTNASP